MLTVAFPTYLVRLSGSNPNPALQNADTEWNIENQIAMSVGISRSKRVYSNKDPTVSIVTLMMMTVQSSPRAVVPFVLPRLVANNDESRVVNLRPNTYSKNVEKVMIPIPPSWIESRITTCPKLVKYVPVSTTVRPVTQVADVMVKSASMKPIEPPVVACGSINTNVAARIYAAKLNARIFSGANRLSGLKPRSIGRLRSNRVILVVRDNMLL